MRLAAQRRGLMAAACVISLLAIAGCYAPDYQEGLACSESGACPEGQTCVSGFCSIGNQASSPDATPTLDLDAQAQSDGADVCESGTQTFVFTGTIENFEVPDCVETLTIEAFGGQGGGGRNGVGGGGLGARMKGDFAVVGGESLGVLVGGEGIDGFPAQSIVGNISTDLQQGGGTGGGGSYVVRGLNEALLVAGGGGGATHSGVVNVNTGAITSEVLIQGGPGQIGEAGQAGGGTGGAPGGTSGSGGTTRANIGFHSGTGGGGFIGNGIDDSNGSGNFGTANTPGRSYINGGAGGVGGSIGRNGAFGGGGSAGFVGGGGGGYSGGGTGSIDGTHGGGGGGSFNAGSNPDNSPGVRSGSGEVVFSW